jgi:hypothetical protein
MRILFLILIAFLITVSWMLLSAIPSSAQDYAVIPIERIRQERIVTVEHFDSKEKAISQAAYRDNCEVFDEIGKMGGANLICGIKIKGILRMSSVSEE